MKLVDYHIHSLYSSDSSAKLEDIANSAITKGLKEIVITDHFEPTSVDNEYTYYNPVDQLVSIETLNEKLDGKLKIRQGVELGQPHHYPNLIREVKAKVNFDYIIGSAHKDLHDIDVNQINYGLENLDIICRKYLKEVVSMVKDNQFDCVGHLDLIKRYASRQGITISIRPYQEQLEEIFKILINNGKGIEINTSGLRESMKSFMPDFDIVSFYKELGGEIVTIGSDAHYAKHVGEGLNLAMDMLRNVGFRYITVFDKRVANFEAITSSEKYYKLVI